MNEEKFSFFERFKEDVQWNEGNKRDDFIIFSFIMAFICWITLFPFALLFVLIVKAHVWSLIQMILFKIKYRNDEWFTYWKW